MALLELDFRISDFSDTPVQLMSLKITLRDDVGDFFCSCAGTGRDGVAKVLLCPGVGTSSVREEDSGAEINKGPMTRPSALAMVGGRCQDGHHHEGVVDELFSSEVNLRNVMEVGWRRAVL